jgi:hypothetical protein
MLLPQLFALIENGAAVLTLNPFRGSPPGLATLTERGTPLDPTTTEPKFSATGDAVSPAFVTPVPSRATVVKVLAELLRLRLPLRAPLAEGVKLTPSVQLAPAASMAVQLFDPRL